MPPIGELGHADLVPVPLWATLCARAATDGDEAKETKIRLSRTLVALAADGITDAKDLGSKASENMVLTSR